MNKNAMIFTIMIISILSLFLVSFSTISVVKNRDSVNKRIETMNSFVFSLEEDLPRKLYISGFRIIWLLEKEIINTENYLSNFNQSFEEAFFNGTINGQTNFEIQQLMSQSTFEGIQESLATKANKINANVTLSNPNISISQDNPWNIKITLTGNLLVNDLSGLALWNRTFNISGYMPIESFEDPLYIVSTDNLVTTKINKTDTPGTIQESLTNSQYINSSSAPSFLDRFEGKLDPNENGITSLVNLPQLSAQGIPLKIKSIADYIYFNDANNPSSCPISGESSWIRLDATHRTIYGVACA